MGYHKTCNPAGLTLRNYLKRIWTLLLVVLALLSVVQHPSCCCLQSQVASTPVTEEHSCCQQQSASNSQNGSQYWLGNSRSCCGIVGRLLPATANSIDLLGLSEEFRIKKVCASTLVAELVNDHIPIDSLGWANRAPPRLKGLGTSDTYLFKRTLLI